MSAALSPSSVSPRAILGGWPSCSVCRTGTNPSTACLATRIPYGQRITLERLKRIEAAEEAVRALTGARQVRVRDHGDIARIEVGRGERRLFFSEEAMDEVARRLKQLGWRYVALDLEGYRSGSMDEGLADKLSPKAQHAV